MAFPEYDYVNLENPDVLEEAKADPRRFLTHEAGYPMNRYDTYLIKNYYNAAEISALYYWRDNTGNEIDCLIEDNDQIKSIETKSSTTISTAFFKCLNYYRQLNAKTDSYLLYGGNKNSLRSDTQIISWNDTETVLSKNES